MGRKRKTESGKEVITKRLPLSFERVGNVDIVISWQYSHYCPNCGELFGGICNTQFPNFCYKCREKLRWNLENEPFVNKEGREMIGRIMSHEFIPPEELEIFLESENVYTSSRPSNGGTVRAEDFIRFQKCYEELTRK